MVKIDKITISLFMFALESYLLEQNLIQNIKELDWQIVESYRNYVLRDHPHFKLEKKQMKSFIKHYKDRCKELQKRKRPLDLEPLKHLLREYAPTGYPPAEPAIDLRPSFNTLVGQLMSEIADMRSQLMSEIADMRSQLMSEMRELRSESVEMRSTLTLSLAHRPSGELLQPAQAQLERAIRAGAKHQLEQQRATLARSRPGAAHQGDTARPSLPDFKAILQSVESPRPFIRARQRVALLVLYIEGLKLSQLLTLDVRHLKELRAVKGGAKHLAEDAQGVKPALAQGETLALRASLYDLGEAKDILDDDALGIATDLEMLIGDYPDSTPAFRAKAHSARSCTREGLTRELNHTLSKWKCSTKSLCVHTHTSVPLARRL